MPDDVRNVVDAYHLNVLGWIIPCLSTPVLPTLISPTLGQKVLFHQLIGKWISGGIVTPCTRFVYLPRAVVEFTNMYWSTVFWQGTPEYIRICGSNPEGADSNRSVPNRAGSWSMPSTTSPETHQLKNLYEARVKPCGIYTGFEPSQQARYMCIKTHSIDRKHRAYYMKFRLMEEGWV